MLSTDADKSIDRLSNKKNRSLILKKVREFGYFYESAVNGGMYINNEKLQPLETLSKLESTTMPSSAKIGKSIRSPFKHWVLRCHTAGLVSAYLRKNPKVPARPPIHFVDLCAGNGYHDKSYKSSSIILLEKASCLCDMNIPAYVTLIENNMLTCSELEKSVDTYRNCRLAQNQKCAPCSVLNSDAGDFRIEPMFDNQGIFVNCDPNSMGTMPLRRKFISSLSKTSTFLVSMGCNVSGLKRLEIEVRKEWRSFAEDLTRAMPRWHDVLLIRLLGDASQWAYLLRIPSCWVSQHRETISSFHNEEFLFEIQIDSYRSQRPRFEDSLNSLFFTKKERNGQ